MKKSFTMAEVLITLGIIGIIAAMTLPALINKYDLYVRQQQFKKAYATLSNALQRADFELGGYTRCHYPENSNLGFQNADCPLLYSTITSYFNKLKKNVKEMRLPADVCRRTLINLRKVFLLQIIRIWMSMKLKTNM